MKEAVARLRDRAAFPPAPEPGGELRGDVTRGTLPDFARRSLLQWALVWMPRIGAAPDVAVSAPHADLGLVHHRAGEREIFFLANASRTESVDSVARFPTGDRRPWRWDLETGTRAPMPFSAQPDTLALHLEPLESLLLVFEPVIPRDPGSSLSFRGTPARRVPRNPQSQRRGRRMTGRGPPAPAGTGCRSSRRGRWRSAPRAERLSTAASPSSST